MSDTLNFWDGGIREVRMLRSDRSIAVGYFDSQDAALRAIENEPSHYIAVWFTLNPLQQMPLGTSLNPPILKPAATAAADTNITRRCWFLIDCDPQRPAGTNSTAAEKETSRKLAEAIREYLRGRGWPEPTFADSGNGSHLLYRIDLPNDLESKEVIRAILSRLAGMFDNSASKVDVGNFNAARVCKFYGSWSRKGEHSDERPHRRSAILQQPDLCEVVTVQQLKALSGRNDLVLRITDAKVQKLVDFLQHYSVPVLSEPREIRNGYQIEIQCPWVAEHSGDNPRDSVVSHDGIRGFGFKCLHAHCLDRHWKAFRAELERRNPGLPAFFRGLPRMSHADIARDFIAENEDFCCLYNAPGSPIAAWVGTRWDVGDDGSRLLRKAVRAHLDALFHRYPEPEENKKDYRLVLLSAPFANHVMMEIRPLLPPVRREEFDADPHLLGLPGARVVDLRNGSMRPMLRQDCITKRLYIAPEDVATPRWDRFLDEIALGDGALAAYLVRLCALVLTGLPYQGLFFLWGGGRNGKGVLLRLMSKVILGEGVFACTLRPSEITSNAREDSDSAKRTFAKFAGMRLATVQETVGNRLNLPVLKILSGGDTLSGAKMRQDDVQFAPTHKLLLPTNDKPDLPADPAFRGRVHFIPFLADYSDEKKQDKQLESDLKAEASGILHKLMSVCPDVIQNGLRAPASVLAATKELFDDLDVTQQFLEDCLKQASGSFVGLADMEAAVRKWLPGMVVGESGDRRVIQVIEGLKARFKYTRLRRGDGERQRGFVGVELCPSVPG